jgi:uncharacterized protein
MVLSRLARLEQKVLGLILEQYKVDIQRDIPLDYEISHIFGTVMISRILSRKRNSPDEEGALISVLHDLGRILTGRQENHAETGYGPAREVLTSMGIFGADEVERISEGVRAHSRKELAGSEAEEVVKDADILDYYLFGLPIVKESHRVRLERVLEELGIPGEGG